MDHRPPRSEQPYAWDDERLSAYLDGELSAPEQAQLEARLVVDPELRQLVDELRAVRQQLEILPEYRLKPSFADQVLRRAEQEMLLSPLGREESNASSVAMPTAPLPEATVPAATDPALKVQPAVLLQSERSGRRWRRGAIWTAVAAAAVLLLIVTNQPNAPQQDHVARYDLPKSAKVQSTPGKASTAPEASNPGLDKNSQNLNALGGKETERLGLAKAGERETQGVPVEQLTQPKASVLGDVPGINSATSPPASPPSAAAALPKADAAQKPDANQAARMASGKQAAANLQRDGDRQSDSNGGMNAASQGKVLLKNQAPNQLKGMQEKQSAAQREQMSAELTALLASDEFSQLAARQRNADCAADDQVLVVHVTPRDLSNGESSFESLLASNSIDLAEKPLLAASEQQQRSLARTKAEAQDAEPLAKAALKDETGAKDRTAAEMREAGKTEQSNNGATLRKEAAPAPASDLFAETKKSTPVKGVYYLEADAGQVDDLLRQLRSSPAQFTQLNIMPRALKLAENSPQRQDEKSVAKKPAAASPSAAVRFADDMRAEGTPLAGLQQLGKQESGDAKQLAQGAAPATPAPVLAAPAGPAGAALPGAPTIPAPAAEPFVTPAPIAPQEIASSTPPAIHANDAPMGADGASSPAAAKGGFGQSSNGSGNRRANQSDKSPNVSGDRAIAYRLRGVESLLPAKQDEQLAAASEGGGAGGGSAMLAKAEFDKLKSGGTAKRGNAAKAPEPAKPGDARSQIKAESGPKLDAKTAEASSGDALPAAQPMAAAATVPAPSILTQEKKLEQPNLQADSSGEPARMPTPSDTQQRQFARNTEAANAKEFSLAESSAIAGASSAFRSDDATPTEFAKKAAPAAEAKRVRVLFVIDREPGE